MIVRAYATAAAVAFGRDAMHDPKQYDRCLASAESIAKRRDPAATYRQTVAVAGECHFARWAGVSAAVIRAAGRDGPLFRYADRLNVAVKTAPFDPDTGARRVALAVHRDELRRRPAHVYVLWSASWKSDAAHPVGWATWFEVNRAPVNTAVKSPSFQHRVLPQGALRPMRQLPGWTADLQQQIAPDLVLDWWIAHDQAAVRRNGVAIGIVYRGSDGWFAIGVDQRFDDPRAAALAAAASPRRCGACDWPF